MDKLDLQRFLSKVAINTNGDCWNWTEAKTRLGYGRFKLGHKTRRAHRVSFEHFKGIIPENLCVLHKCDNPSCVNPEHLFTGTLKDNHRDMDSKGRRCTQLGTCVSIEDILKIEELRKKGHTLKMIGKSFLRSEATISTILNRVGVYARFPKELTVT